VYRKDIVEMTGPYLAEYETVRVEVDLSPEERSEYETERAIYLEFVRGQGSAWAARAAGMISSCARPARWSVSVRCAPIAGSASYRSGPRPSSTTSSACSTRHRDEKALIFTQDNATAYGISKRFLIPIITHQTKVKERSEILERFADGRYRAIATSKVLNEGVDVPDASSRSSSAGAARCASTCSASAAFYGERAINFATLYELVSRKTGEVYTSERRREHRAYGGGST